MAHSGRAALDAAEQATSAFGALRGGDLVMLLVTVTVVLRVGNYHFLKLPSSIMMAFGSIVCTVALLVGAKIPFLHLSKSISDLRLLFMDFPDLVLNNLLGFLLFAAAIEVDLRALGRIRSTIIALSFFTTFISTALVSVLTYLLLLRTSPMNFSWCLLYGAIVSPTDPVAVISILNDKPGLLPSSTRYFVLGESLLNDAVGVVLYLVFSEIVVQPDMNYTQVSVLFFKSFVLECFAGIIIGLLLAWIAYSAIKSCDEPLLEIAITFVLVGNINMICRMLDASIPLASVAAGLFIGNYCTQFAMTEDAVDTFEEMWKLLDETLNSVLFLLIGFADLFWEPQEIGWSTALVVSVSTICISLFARLVSVSCPLFFIIFVEWLTGRRLRHPSVRYRGGTVAVLTWGGMRGGISIALALGVPDAFARHAIPGHMMFGQLIFFMTFSLVVFSICVQGMFFERVVRLINALSYEHFPSGGLGTYASQANFNYVSEDYGAALSGDENSHHLTLNVNGKLDCDQRFTSPPSDQHESWAAFETRQPPYPVDSVRVPAAASYNMGTTDDDDGDGDDDDVKYTSFDARVSDGVTFADQFDLPLQPAPSPSNRMLSPSSRSVWRRKMPPRAVASSPDAFAAPVQTSPREMATLVMPKSAGPEFSASQRSRGFPKSTDDEARCSETDRVSLSSEMSLRGLEAAKSPSADRHRRDGSETFKGLDKLHQLPSIDEIWRTRNFWGNVGVKPQSRSRRTKPPGSALPDPAASQFAGHLESSERSEPEISERNSRESLGAEETGDPGATLAEKKVPPREIAEDVLDSVRNLKLPEISENMGLSDDEEESCCDYGADSTSHRGRDSASSTDQGSSTFRVPPASTRLSRKASRHRMPTRTVNFSPDTAVVPPSSVSLRDMATMTMPKSAGPEFSSSRRARGSSRAPAPGIFPEGQRLQVIAKIPSAARHRRDSSETFKNLDKLQHLPSIDEIWRTRKFWGSAGGKLQQPKGGQPGSGSNLAGQQTSPSLSPGDSSPGISRTGTAARSSTGNGSLPSERSIASDGEGLDKSPVSSGEGEDDVGSAKTAKRTGNIPPLMPRRK